MNNRILRTLGKSCIIKDSKKNIIKLRKGQHYKIIDLRGYIYIFKFLKIEIYDIYTFVNGVEVMYKTPIPYSDFSNYYFNRVCSIDAIKEISSLTLEEFNLTHKPIGEELEDYSDLDF